MTTVIFIHGTGVREAAYKKSFNEIQNELQDRRANLRLVRCAWGDTCGSKLHNGGASIPFYDTSRSTQPGELSESEAAIMLWELLYQDPLYELRILSLMPSTAAPAVVPGGNSPGILINTQMGKLMQNPTVKGYVQTHGLEQYLADAYTTVSRQRLTRKSFEI